MKKKRVPDCLAKFRWTQLLRVMKLTTFLIFVLVLNVFSASSYSQNSKISVNVVNGTLGEIFNQIEEQSDYRFFYQNEQIREVGRNSVNLSGDSVPDVVSEVLGGTSLTYKLAGKNIIIYPKTETSDNDIAQQQHTISGKVTDTSGEPLPGVTIVVKGTTNGTVTGPDGYYTIGNVPENAVLIFSFIGMKTQEIQVKDQTTINLVMEGETVGLQEVVAIGYGVQKKKLVTGATSQISSKNIEQSKTVSVVDAMKSFTSGVQIVKKSGQPGESYNINIRGMGTIGNATPLFIVDGTPVSNIDFINPSDIQSIDVLKDAASSAIYGSRAANGVILITTKKGRFETKPTITYDGYYGLQNLYKTVPLLNAPEYAAMMNEARINDKLMPYDYASIIPNWSDIESGKSKGTNWLDAITVKDAPIQNHSLGFNGGTKSSSYSIGFSYTSQDGILGKPVASSYDRYNVRVNTEHIIYQHNNRDILKIGENIVYSYYEKSGIAIGGMYNNAIRNMLSTTPLMPLYDDKGNYHYAIDAWDVRVANPVGVMDYNSRNISKNHRLLASAFAELQPIKDLTIKSSFGYSLSGSSYRSYVPAYRLSERAFNNESDIYHSMSLGSGYTFENTANYVFTIKGEHKFNILAGNTIQKDGIGESITGQNVNSIFDDLEHAYLINAEKIDAKNTQLSSYPWGENMLLSYFGRLNYNFREKYLLTLVARADGSSKFARGKRWGYFPSVAAGWIASSEPFMKGTEKWLDFLKVRASWGQNGNQNIDSFQYLSSIAFDASYYTLDKTNRLVGAYPSIMPNPDITWETSEQTDVGLDSRFFGSKLSFSFDWYKKTTKDWLVRAPALASYGTTAPYINGGDVENTGVEFSLQWNDQIGELHYRVGANLSHNRNRITRIANSEKIIHGPTNILADLTSEIFRAEEGMPIGYFWGYKTDGIFQNEQEVLDYKNSKGELIQPDATPGDVRFVNMNDDNIIDDKDKVEIGDPNPDFIFGMSIGADYKGFDISVNANGVAGNQIIRSYRDFGIYPRHNYTTEIFGRWHGEGTSSRLPKLSTLSSINATNISDLYIENGDYLRISDVSFGYDFKTLYRQLPFQKLRAYIAVQNLYTFTNYSGMDPEVGYNGGVSFGSGIDLGYYPSPRTVMFGFNIVL
ncbi:TonB-dependent receptor [Prolixibacter bellariivorans]|uniref:TonB-dependent receptor n=1 Tax=Prolixibacter bellariivorans TaxID=314319 RepID=UPI0004725351|nr:TonB-dependent receptor [Prolixibacter bellariivorans]